MNTMEFAIKMELDGERYYRRQAELNKENSLYPICLMLADDEARHARILTGKSKHLNYELTDSATLATAKNIFNGIEDFKMDLKPNPSQLDFYRIATEMERQSIALYSEFLAKAEQPGEVELFEYLIGQEKQHFEILDELSTLLRHAEEWIESAEFGLRKDF